MSSEPKVLTGMSRRKVLGLLATAPLAALAQGAAAQGLPQAGRPASFVLVHGAWHGGWCWRKLTPLLRAAGHEVFTPTLTGLGERAHLIGPGIDLDVHVEDVAAVLEYEDPHDVVLVGHSSGGMVISGVASVAGERLSQLVYLDAFLPEDGKALSDYAPVPPTRPDGWRIPVPGGIAFFGVTEPEDVAWAEPRLGDQPLATFTQPAQVSGEAHAALQRTFVHCSESPWFVEAASRARQEGFAFHDMLAAGHDAMITRPQELAEVLLGLV